MFLGLFGIVRADEATVTEAVSTVTVSGEISTDMSFGGDSNTFVSPYTGLTFSGDGWTISTNLSDGDVNIEEAKYSWSPVDKVTLTFGSQAEPYGLAWGLHRPSNNWFVSSPREHAVSNGVGVSANVVGIGVDAFYGGSSEDVLDDAGVVTEEGSQIWATRLSYGASAGKVGYSIGLSLNSNEAQLIDVSVNSDLFETSFEYDLSSEADGAYWLRGVVNPDFLFGAYLLVGYNSDEEVLYGVGYKCSDNFKFATEFSSDDEDDSGITFRASYSF
jgi:hypothetical protein